MGASIRMCMPVQNLHRHRIDSNPFFIRLRHIDISLFIIALVANSSKTPKRIIGRVVHVGWDLWLWK
jgi:hypothetical protein